MSTSISTPASLATFPQPHASTSKLPHVTLSPVEGGDGNQAVAAVQGDGVWTYDLRTMRPMTSFTVPPSTIFSSAPVSLYYQSKGKDKGKASEEDVDMDGAESTRDVENVIERMTAIALEKGEGVTKETRRKVIWAWTGDEETHRTITLKETISGLHRTANPTLPILAVHSASSFSLISQSDSEPIIVKSADKTSSNAEVLASQVIFTSAEHTRCVVVDALGHWTLVAIENGQAEKQKEGRLTEGDNRKFVSASISKDGVITAIDSSSQLVSKHISDPVSTSFPTLLHPTSTPLSLSLPTFGKPLVILSTSHPTPTILLSIASSTVPALLSTSSVSSASTNTTISHLALLGQTSSHVLTVGVVLHHSSEDGGRSVIYTCEITIPGKGIGLNALLGSQARTEEYISLSSASQAANGSIDRDEDVREKCIAEIETALSKGDTKAATARLNDLLSDQYATLPGFFVKKLIKLVFETALPELKGEGESKKRGPYASKIVSTLLARGLVNDEMINGGVVAAGLIPLGDWDNVMIALPKLPTLPSSALVAVIKATLQNPSNGAPSLEKVLTAILDLAPPAPTYRVELKRGLGVEEATSVLEIITQWAEQWVTTSSKGLKWDIDQNLPETTEDSTSIPSLEAVINHASLLLDSHLPIFLSHPPSYGVLTRMQASLEPLLVMQAEYRALRAPLEAVLTLSKRSERDQQERQRKSELMHGAFGKKGKTQPAQGQGQGKMGEAKIGKWKVEDFVF